MMTKKIFLFAVIVMTFSLVKAQKIELSPFIGYETGARVYTNLGYLRIGDGMDFGGSLDVGIGGGRYVELSYSHMKSYLDLDEGLSTQRLCDLAIDYYSAGVLQEIRPDAKATPYGLLSLGWVNYRPTTNNLTSENKMHLSLAGGIKVRATDRIGLRLQARFLMPIYYAGTYFSIGTGGGGYGISGGAVAVQGDFTAALVFMLR